MILLVLGSAGYIELFGAEVLTLVRQLAEDMLVASVDMLRVLELLYRVNAEVDVPALDMVLIEVRQLLDAMELALEARGRPLRALFGETALSEILSTGVRMGWARTLHPRGRLSSSALMG